MNYGPLVFLAAFFALASSWCGFVLSPQLQIGRLQQTNTLGGVVVSYPVARPGLAHQGLEVYRANGCACCHSQQVGQTGMVVDIVLTDAGTNQAATVAALLNLANDSSNQSAVLRPLPALKLGGADSTSTNLLGGLPKAFLRSATPKAAGAAVKALNATSAKAEAWIVPDGPDIARGWGKRRTVAEDFLFDSPIMPGSQRVGPDLADVGTRLPDANWHLLHLYAPQLPGQGIHHAAVSVSVRAATRLGAARRPTRWFSPAIWRPLKAMKWCQRQAAKALAAYLINLHADAPLFVAPLTVASAPAATPTNAPAVSAATATNAAPAPAPAK